MDSQFNIDFCWSYLQRMFRYRWKSLRWRKKNNQQEKNKTFRQMEIEEHDANATPKWYEKPIKGEQTMEIPTLRAR